MKRSIAPCPVEGLYDRLLEKSRAYSIGVGFKEQLIELLASDPHGIQLDHLCLVQKDNASILEIAQSYTQDFGV